MPVAFNAHPNYYVYEKLEKLVQDAYLHSFDLGEAIRLIVKTPGAQMNPFDLEDWVKDLERRYEASLSALLEMRELLNWD
jgi:hypothetical protein